MMEKKDKIVLIGMPGCGKTTFGKVLAAELNYNFIDMDDYVEAISNRTIKELFAESEEVFRDWETKACKELSRRKKVIISSGGGVIKKSENIDILKKECTIVFIDRPVENIAEDVEVSTRPLLKNGKEALYKLYKERYELYKNAADITILNNGFIKDVINNCKDQLKNLIK